MSETTPAFGIPIPPGGDSSIISRGLRSALLAIDDLVGSELRGPAGPPGGGGAATYEPSAATAPSTYATGISVGAVTTAQGYPQPGTLLTVKRSGSRTLQWLASTDANATTPPVLYFRYGYHDATRDHWGPWAGIGVPPANFDTGNAGELVTSLPVPTVADSSHRRVVFSQRIDDLRTGNLLMCASEFQVTNDTGYNVMCVSQLILANSATATTGWEITEASGRNVTPGMHHDLINKVGNVSVPSSYQGTQYVNLVAYAASTAATPGATIAVDGDYGRLQIVRF